MRTIVHLSDLHFGRVDEPLLRPLERIVWSLQPHLVVISGDLTQRARSAEFREARAFLDALPRPQIVVPGNHDVPLHNVFARFVSKLDKYQRLITEDLEPFHLDDEIAVLGLNTARAWTLRDGRISHEQIEGLRTRMCELHGNRTKLLVTHHPFDPPEHAHHKVAVGRAGTAMEAIAACGVEIILSGHLHLSHTGHSAHRFRHHGHSTLIVQAGTATSTRTRGEEPNSFNVVRIDRPRVSVECISWQPQSVSFTTRSVEHFERAGAGAWARLPIETESEVG